MSRELEDLNPGFKEKVDLLLKRCFNDGIVMRPFFTLRSVYDQAKLWRQSRCWEEISNKIEFLISQEAYFIVDVLQSVGPTNGRWATNAIPGQSIHQYGYATDCYNLVKGDNSRYIANWDGDSNAYKIYAHHAKDLGMNAGYFWNKKDSVHVECSNFSIPKDWKIIDEMMKDKFGRD
jgi:hypothetical protein